MKLKRGEGWHTVPAHREFFLTLCRDGKTFTWYDGCLYHSEADAQKRADIFNAHRKQGKIIVQYVDRPEQQAYTLGTIKL